jgi:fatty acid desaturase
MTSSTLDTAAVAPPSPSSALDRWLVSTLNDPRDLPFAHLMIACGAVVAFGVGLYFAGDAFWYLVPVYASAWGFGLVDRFILMLHCTSHRRLFKKRYERLNLLIPWVIGPFFGETPETYFAHHLGMHHPENNLPDDLSSTMRFHRDRFSDWLRYYGRFLFFGLFELSRYHKRKQNRKLFRRTVVGEVGFWAIIAVLAWIDLRATLVVFVAPVLLVRTLMMVGNWGQHAFVDASDPSSAYKNSITCVNTRYNRRCFNDGYHIHHHVRATCHWSELPAEFEANRATYGREDAIVFDGVDFFQVWVLLMLKQHRRLAARVVKLPGAPERTFEQTVEWLRTRLRPIPGAAAESAEAA